MVTRLMGNIGRYVNAKKFYYCSCIEKRYPFWHAQLYSVIRVYDCHKILGFGTPGSEKTVQIHIRVHRLTHYILVDSSTVICWTIPFVI